MYETYVVLHFNLFVVISVKFCEKYLNVKHPVFIVNETAKILMILKFRVHNITLELKKFVHGI